MRARGFGAGEPAVLSMRRLHELCRCKAGLLDKQGGEMGGAKVRDLVDALDGRGSGDTVHGQGVFVTKHEILMVRRSMGGGC